MKDEVLLSRVPSELLKIALEDIKKTVSQGIKIKMDVWGKGRVSDKRSCSVCFAGSVMLQTTQVNRDPSGFYSLTDNEDQYVFLDKIRRGYLGFACRILLETETFLKTENKYETTVFCSEIKDWKQWSDCDSPDEFYKQIEDLIVFFKSRNL